MWYLYLRRDQHYLRSYRTHNLWLNMYHKKMRIPKINAWHVAVMRRMSKSVSTVSRSRHPPFSFMLVLPFWHPCTYAVCHTRERCWLNQFLL